MDRKAFREFFSFAVVGVVNTVLCLSVIWVLGWYGVGPYGSNMAGYAVGLTNSFLMNRAFTFRSSAWGFGVVVRFIGVFVAAYSVNIGVLSLGLHLGGAAVFLWQVGAMICYTLTFFTLSKMLVFQ